jgi:hypothetical protein
MSFRRSKNLLRPAGAKKEKKKMNSFLSFAFHGFRVGSLRDRAAPPVATFHSPVGAETAYAGRNSRSRIDILCGHMMRTYSA